MRSQVADLGRSMFRLSWAMTVFGAQQAARLVAGAGGEAAGARPAEAFDAVASAVEGQFGGVFRGAYETGKSWLYGREAREAAAKR